MIQHEKTARADLEFTNEAAEVGRRCLTATVAKPVRCSELLFHRQHERRPNNEPGLIAIGPKIDADVFCAQGRFDGSALAVLSDQIVQNQNVDAFPTITLDGFSPAEFSGFG